MDFRVLWILNHACDINQVTSLRIETDEAEAPGLEEPMIKRFQKKS